MNESEGQIIAGDERLQKDMTLTIVSGYRFSDAEIGRVAVLGGEYHFTEKADTLPVDVRDRAAIFIGAANHLDEAFFAALPAIRWVHHPAAGVNTNTRWVDWELVRRHQLIVTATRIHETSISEMIVTYMLMLAKQMPGFTAQQRERTYKGLRTRLLSGTTALIVGTGNIGRETARKLTAGFGLRVIGINSDGRPIENCDEVHTLKALPRLAGECDWLIVCLPLTEETRGLIDRAILEKIKPTACLINIARGPIIDEDALVAALKEGRIAGAGLDTFVQEPLPAESPLWTLPNVIITPHVAGSFTGYHARVMDSFLENFRYFKDGRYELMPHRADTKGY
jgi:phosphoglycerate dehydrogenase-like enzyme